MNENNKSGQERIVDFLSTNWRFIGVMLVSLGVLYASFLELGRKVDNTMSLLQEIKQDTNKQLQGIKEDLAKQERNYDRTQDKLDYLVKQGNDLSLDNKDQWSEIRSLKTQVTLMDANVGVIQWRLNNESFGQKKK